MLARQEGKKTKVFVLLLGASLLVLVSLALGLGLGLGLSRRKSNSSSEHFSTLPSVDPSQQILQPWNVNATPQTREYTFIVSNQNSAPAGLAKEIYVVNGTSPGPLIEANLGDEIVVHVFNRLNTSTAIHWHGQYQRGTNNMDGTFGVTECGIPPGQSYTYNWTVQNTGTYWWHAHDGMQYSDGLYGPLILHGPKDPSYDSQGDRVIIAADLYDNLASSYLTQYRSPQGPMGGMQGDEPVPDCGVVNGLGVCAGGERDAIKTNLTDFEPGKQYRFRLINAGSLAMIRFELEGHTMTVIEADGTPVEPLTVSSVTVKAAQRYSVLIRMDQPAAAYRFRADLTKDMFMYEKASLITEQSATLFYQSIPTTTPPLNISMNSSVAANMSERAMIHLTSSTTTTNAETSGKNMTNSSMDSSATMNDGMMSMNSSTSMDDGMMSMENNTLEAMLKPLFASNPPAPTKLQSLVIRKGMGSDMLLNFYFNDSSWMPTKGEATLYAVLDNSTTLLADELILTNENIEVLDLILINEDKDEHPMHLHGFDPYILGSGTGTFQPGQTLDLTQEFNNPMRRDVFTLPGKGWTVIRVVLDNPGIWIFHCHIAWHMEVGFATQFNVLPDQLALQQVDQKAQSFCAVR